MKSRPILGGVCVVGAIAVAVTVLAAMTMATGQREQRALTWAEMSGVYGKCKCYTITVEAGECMGSVECDTCTEALGKVAPACPATAITRLNRLFDIQDPNSSTKPINNKLYLKGMKGCWQNHYCDFSDEFKNYACDLELAMCYVQAGYNCRECWEGDAVPNDKQDYESGTCPPVEG